MPLAIEFAARAAAELENLPPRVATRIIAKVEWLAAHPSARVERLVGLPAHLDGLLKLRVGAYRVLFWLTEDKIYVVRVGHRSRIYRDLK